MDDDVLLLVDAEVILRIPICTEKVDDFCAWIAYRRGCFSVLWHTISLSEQNAAEKAEMDEGTGHLD